MDRPQLRSRTRRRLIAELRERDGDLCVWCRELLDFAEKQLSERNHPDQPTLEHVIPWRACRSNDLDVLALAHQRCNHDNNSRPQRRLPEPPRII